MRKDELYSFFDRIDKAHEDEADAIASAVSYMLENSNPSQLHQNKFSPNTFATATSCGIRPKSSNSSAPAHLRSAQPYAQHASRKSVI